MLQRRVANTGAAAAALQGNNKSKLSHHDYTQQEHTTQRALQNTGTLVVLSHRAAVRISLAGQDNDTRWPLVL